MTFHKYPPNYCPFNHSSVFNITIQLKILTKFNDTKQINLAYHLLLHNYRKPRRQLGFVWHLK